MTATAHFSSRGFFPGCTPENSSRPFTADNVSLADAMALAWKLETCTITTTGTVTRTAGSYTLDAATTFTLDPITASSPFDHVGGQPTMAYPYFESTPFASAPRIRAPHERVCNTGFSDSIVDVICTDTDIADPVELIWFQVWVWPDDGNPGKYKIHINFIIARHYPSLAINMSLFYRTITSGSGTLLASGTITLWGFSVPWYAYGFNYDTYTTPTLTATSSSFTF